MKYLIGIDAGGTKSELIAYDLNNNPIYSKTGGFGNPAVNLDKTINNIISLIGDCTNELGRDECQLIAIGMAAVETGNYAQLIKKYVEGVYVIETIVLNDAEMACKAYFGDKDGILAIAGTGSSCFVQRDGKGEIVGGWSHILGDEGSGYHTVIEVFKNIICKYDRDMPLNNLNKALLDKIGGISRSDIMDFIYSNEKNTIASLFPIIVDYSINGDSYAVKLLENAGKKLAELTCVAYRKKGFKGGVTIGIKGGVFHNSCCIVSSYMNEIQNNLNDFDIIGEDISATKGVCNLYNKNR
ncbi:MAG: BadF/BadG/BcrA/BcrD ATPase family protein [Sedimentibacter sp.]|uniref:BadF/BadG/BcrA/BcrD ATPase family protein n=1 Tax=Sedimentibacter sp. TaxID=1960295 RepID=UPI002981E02F|nr:BadF/BadG/BcrA/BcrD ATPase family protein [Sedimentibacter sp.]MDW5298963.1 BadF/BadG/BcrA/BcrD ATPase family protein [Sedimentibacter sp.]